MTAQPCSFCGAEATTARADEYDIFPSCEECAVAWDANPGFADESKAPETGEE